MPIDAFEVVVMLQTHAPDFLEEARPHPGLEAQMAGAAGTVFARYHLPLAAGAQDIQHAIENDAVGHRRPPIAPRWLVGRQDRFDQVPQVIRDLAESIPLLGFSTHRIVLHDVTMLLSALTNEEREGF